MQIYCMMRIAFFPESKSQFKSNLQKFTLVGRRISKNSKLLTHTISRSHQHLDGVPFSHNINIEGWKVRVTC